MSTTMNRVAHALRSASPFHHARGTVVPNPHHLDYRCRIFRSPLAHASVLFGLLRNDPDFRNVIPSGRRDYLLQFAVCDNELRVNCFVMEPEAEDVIPVYEADWQSEGVFSYHLRPDKTAQLITRDLPGKYYHPEDPKFSFVRVLSAEELMEIDGMTFHHTRKAM